MSKAKHNSESQTFKAAVWPSVVVILTQMLFVGCSSVLIATRP